ncbi:MAG TPA: CbiX/SirB N-terminal domain-containing protein [Candidatus Acidoferrales bacterium]
MSAEISHQVQGKPASKKAGKLGILIFAHGSSVPEANQTIARLAEEVARTSGYNYVRPSFLELGEPDLITAVAGARQAGIERVVVVPYFLTMGIHLRRDLPKLIEEVQRRFPEIEIRLAESLDGHPLMAHLVTERAREALARGEPRLDRGERAQKK